MPRIRQISAKGGSTRTVPSKNTRTGSRVPSTPASARSSRPAGEAGSWNQYGRVTLASVSRSSCERADDAAPTIRTGATSGSWDLSQAARNSLTAG